MLNRVILMGRITQDLEVRQTGGGQAVLSFSIAVQRNYKDQSGQYPTDFIDCVAWGQQAEFIARYFGKGRMIAIEGNLRKRAYEDKNGVKHYPTEVYVDSAQFTGEPKQGGGNYSNNYGGGFNGGNGGYNNGGFGGGNGGFNNGGDNFGGNNYGGNNFGNGGFNQNNGGQGNFGGGNNAAPSNDALNIGDLSEFEDVISDDGVPF
ncbi:single-stranded DNA-binding protein [uncultured Ruminococcus sp.]|jgi:single-strand DNA-binding protein|uniref:single-stranded DNA-binding protein n=1 Tax=uncultured Ruminococcus sp. TaxID=165186 RepID=UPI0025F19EBD|nr:single-stranded DNA-binding protein [uncultured Ruminococcus sp.]